MGSQAVSTKIKNLETAIFNPWRFFIVLKTMEDTLRR